MEEVNAGDTVRVDIKNNAPIGGDTQQTTFTVEEVHINKIVGVDEAWGDTCVVEGFGTGDLSFSDAGKSGEVVDVQVMDTTDDGVVIHGSGTSVLN